MTLSLASIHIHPIKSLGGFAVDSSRLTDRGLEHDRRWMLIDHVGRFVSQREIPQMACLHCVRGDSGFQVTDIRDGSSIALPWSVADGQRSVAKVWDDAVAVIHASAKTSSWFSERLGAALSLVFMPDDSQRPTDDRYAKAFTSLSDGFPYLIISQASLDDLNARLGSTDQMDMDRFRPNLVIAGGGAFQEDGWQRIDVGGTTFDLVKPCARCVITTTDQRTGERGKEPLRTLAHFRKRVAAEGISKVDFGMNAVADRSGMIHVGSPIQVLSYAG